MITLMASIAILFVTSIWFVFELAAVYRISFERQPDRRHLLTGLFVLGGIYFGAVGASLLIFILTGVVL
jgi:hypothetical protein